THKRVQRPLPGELQVTLTRSQRTKINGEILNRSIGGKKAVLNLGFIQLGAMKSSLKMAIQSYISLCGTPETYLEDILEKMALQFSTP
ncbi:hypothetical protein L9F63_007707, partial [Diploptera punctata]